MKTDIVLWGRFSSAIALAISLIGTAIPVLAQPAGPVEPAVYEDRNNNGVFDLGDRDLSGLPVGENISTTESVVINRLSIRVEPYVLKRITAGKGVTIRGNIAITTKQGQLRITAPQLRIANNVSITVVSYFDAEISGPVIIGDNVKMQSLGKSASVGYGTISMRGHDIQAGTNFHATVYDGFSAEAIGGELFFGPQATLRTLSGPLYLQATMLISVENARSISGEGGVDFVLENRDRGMAEITGSRLKTGSESQVGFYGGDVNFTSSLISSPRYCLYYTNDHPREVTCVEQ